MMDKGIFDDRMGAYIRKYGPQSIDQYARVIWWTNLKDIENEVFKNAIDNMMGSSRSKFTWQDLRQSCRAPYKEKAYVTAESVLQSENETCTDSEKVFYIKLHRALDRADPSKDHPSGYWQDRYYRILTKYEGANIYEYARETGIPEFQRWVEQNAKAIIGNLHNSNKATGGQSQPISGSW